MNLVRLCDKIIYVKADPEVRVKRLMATRGWTEERARQRLFSQDKEPTDIKIKIPAQDIFSNFQRLKDDEIFMLLKYSNFSPDIFS